MAILITAAHGTVSREVARELVAAGHNVRVLVRRRDENRELAGVEYVVGDLDRPGTLAPAFEGVTGLWLLTPMGPPSRRPANRGRG